MQFYKTIQPRTIVTITSFLALSAVCFSQTQASGPVYKSAAFNISYPTGWAIDTSKKQGAEVFLFSPLEDSLDRFRENINIIVQNLEGLGIDLKKFTGISQKQISDMSADAKINSSQTISNKQGTFQKIIYSATASGYKLKFEQYYFVQKSNAYIITFTSEQSKFEQYKTGAEQTLASFKLN